MEVEIITTKPKNIGGGIKPASYIMMDGIMTEGIKEDDIIDAIKNDEAILHKVYEKYKKKRLLL